MKVTCEYCGSYVEADENLKCPLCGATLGSAVDTERARLQEQAELERQHEAEEAAQEAKDAHISEIIDGVASVATAFAANTAATSSQTHTQPPEHEKHTAPPAHDFGDRSFNRPARDDGSRSARDDGNGHAHEMHRPPRGGHPSGHDNMSQQDARTKPASSNRPSHRGAPAQRSSRPPHDR